MTALSTNPEQRAAWLRGLAAQHGFAQVGFAAIGDDELPRHRFYREWLAADLCGEMTYLRQQADERRHPRALLESARTVVCVAVPYFHPLTAGDDSLRGRIARYAWGEDYHLVLKRRLADLAQAVAQALGEGQVAYRICVDSAPLLEREVAAQAGLGFVGKNTLLITPGVGSFTVLGELLLALEVPDAPDVVEPRCGQCRLCLDVCPTGALLDAYRIDARRCISYLTIELQGAIPVRLRAPMGTWIFGCDLCQDVCPWNAAARGGDADSAQHRGAPFIELKPRALAAALPELVPLLGIGAAQFRRFVKRRALRRVSRAQLLRNVAVALGNVGTAAEVPALAAALAEPSALIRQHVAWALGEVAARAPATQPEVQAALAAALAREGDEAVIRELRAALRRAAGASTEETWPMVEALS